jgi:hypothetical protein
MADIPVVPPASTPAKPMLLKTIFALAIPLATVTSGLIGVSWLAKLNYLDPLGFVIGSFGAALFGWMPLFPALFFLNPGKGALSLGNKFIGLTLLALGLAWIHLIVTVACVGAFELLLSVLGRPAVAAELFWYYCCILIPLLIFNSVERSAAGGTPTIAAYAWNGSAAALTAMIFPHFFMKTLHPTVDATIFSGVSLGFLVFELRTLAKTPDVTLSDLL